MGLWIEHSTNQAIINANEKILENINKNEQIVTVYLDVSKAFDSVNINILLDKLCHYGMRGIDHDF